MTSPIETLIDDMLAEYSVEITLATETLKTPKGKPLVLLMAPFTSTELSWSGHLSSI